MGAVGLAIYMSFNNIGRAYSTFFNTYKYTTG